MRVGLIGVGAIGSYILDGIASGEAGAARVAAVADVPAKEARLRELAAQHECAWTTDPLELPALGAEIVVEAAAQAVVRQYALPLVEAGVDLLVLSVGALADGAFHRELSGAATRKGRRVYLPSGALGGTDALRAARIAGSLEEVTLRTSKPPRALAGAPYFDAHPVDFDALREPTVVFAGTAEEAVKHFPANVNVAATVSLAGLGPERTRVEVVADPALDANVHEVVARGAFGEMRFRFANVPSPANPKTSLLACLSPLATLRSISEPIRLG